MLREMKIIGSKLDKNQKARYIVCNQIMLAMRKKRVQTGRQLDPMNSSSIPLYPKFPATCSLKYRGNSIKGDSSVKPSRTKR